MEQLTQDFQLALLSYYDQIVHWLPKLILAVIVLTIFVFVAGQMKRLAKKGLALRLDDPLLIDFLARILKAIIVLLGVISTLHIIGLGGAASSLIAGAGIGAFVIGFAFKDIGENFLAGIMMAFKRPFQLGDVIETGSITGVVIGLTLRDTQLKTFSGKDVFIPNGMIMKNPIINRTIDGFLRYQFSLEIDCENDLLAAATIIERTVTAIDGILKMPGKNPAAILEKMLERTATITCYFWINTTDHEVSGIRLQAKAIADCVANLQEAGFHLPGAVVETKVYETS